MGAVKIGRGLSLRAALRRLPVGRGRPGSAAAMRTTSGVNPTCMGSALVSLGCPVLGGPFEPSRACSWGEGKRESPF